VSGPESRTLRLLIIVLFLTGTEGCALLPDASESASNGFTRMMKPIGPPRDGIELEVWYIDRPVGDPLIGDALWREIDQISSIPLDVSFHLNEAGIRYGVVGSDLPTTLSALLNDREASAIHQTRRRQIPLFSGGTGELEVASLPQHCRIRLPGQTSHEARDYSAVHCVFQVTAQRIQEGWVRLEFVPEIHHGDPRIRPLAGSAGADWQLQESQQVDPLYDQRFSLELNLGDHVVIGCVGDAADSVGQHFFRGGQSEPGQERLIVISVQGMKQVDPVPVRDWTSLLP
jgi:hypothetical protein